MMIVEENYEGVNIIKKVSPQEKLKLENTIFAIAYAKNPQELKRAVVKMQKDYKHEIINDIIKGLQR